VRVAKNDTSCSSLEMTPAALARSSAAGSLLSPARSAPRPARQPARAAATPQQTAPPAHAANGAVKPDGSVPEALTQGVPVGEQGPSGSAQQGGRRYTLNRIAHSRWEHGIPAVMGAHLMASGAVSPISTSKGACLGLSAAVLRLLRAVGWGQVC